MLLSGPFVRKLCMSRVGVAAFVDARTGALIKATTIRDLPWGAAVCPQLVLLAVGMDHVATIFGGHLYVGPGST